MKASEIVEIWKEIKGFNDYAVSTLGRVRRLTKGRSTWPGRILKPARNRGGYLRVSLRGGGKHVTRHVHRLMASAFLWPREGLEVNHKNGDKTDNRLANLELVTRSENILHSYRTGLRVCPAGEKHYRAKLSEDSVREIRTLRLAGHSQKAIGKKMGVTQGCIGPVLSGKTWKHVEAT